MGAQLVTQVFERWTHLDDTAFRILTKMAVTALDTEKDGKPACLYFGGREALARSLRRSFPEGDSPEAVKARKNIFGDVRKATKRLETAGAVEVVESGKAVRDGNRQTYRLTLLAAHRGGVETPPSGRGESPASGRAQDPPQGGFTAPPKEEEGTTEEEKRISRSARELSAVRHLRATYGLTDTEAATAWTTAKARNPDEIHNPIPYLNKMAKEGDLADIIEAIQLAGRQPAARGEPAPEPPASGQGRTVGEAIAEATPDHHHTATHAPQPPQEPLRSIDGEGDGTETTQPPILTPLDGDVDEHGIPATADRAAARAALDKINNKRREDQQRRTERLQKAQH